jgi:hypothetical protein
VNRAGVIEDVQAELEKPEILEFARQASIQKGEGYADRELGYDHARPAKPWILDVIEFAGKMRYRVSTTANGVYNLQCAIVRRNEPRMEE